MRVGLASPHVELVFHVLAHVPGRARSSLFDPAYVAWVEERLGPANQRPLGEDVLALARHQRHAEASRLQRYARVFGDLEQARRWTTTSLDEVPAEALDRVDQRDELLPADVPLEVLRCAVALELEWWQRLPPAQVPDDLPASLSCIAELAPALSRLPVSLVRSLGWRGRLWDDGVWVGLPSAWVSVHDVAWQAAHEATLAEVHEAGAMHEASAERLSLCLLAARVADDPRREEHARWLARYGGLPSLSTAEGEVLERLRSAT